MASALVAWPRISSTSVISGTGFMKCMPSTSSGRFVAAPSAGDRDRRGVRGEEAPLRHDDVELGRTARAWRLRPRRSPRPRNRRRSKRSSVVVECDAPERGVAVGRGELALLDELREALLDPERVPDRARPATRRADEHARTRAARTPARCRSPSCRCRSRRRAEYRRSCPGAPPFGGCTAAAPGSTTTRLRERCRTRGADVKRADGKVRSEGAAVSPFDRQRDAVAAAEAERRDAAARAIRCHRVEQRRQHARTAGADGVAERDGAAVHVHARGIDAQLAATRPPPAPRRLRSARRGRRRRGASRSSRASRPHGLDGRHHDEPRREAAGRLRRRSARAGVRPSAVGTFAPPSRRARRRRRSRRARCRP